MSLTVVGELDVTTADELRRETAEILGEPGLTRLVLDCRRLEFIDSTGVYALIAGLKTANQNKIEYCLVNVNTRILQLLQLLGLDELLIPDCRI